MTLEFKEGIKKVLVLFCGIFGFNILLWFGIFNNFNTYYMLLGFFVFLFGLALDFAFENDRLRKELKSFGVKSI